MVAWTTMKTWEWRTHPVNGLHKRIVSGSEDALGHGQPAGLTRLESLAFVLSPTLRFPDCHPTVGNRTASLLLAARCSASL